MDTSGAANATSALVSWAHRDPDWTDETASVRRNHVLRLVQELRSHGIDCDVDAMHPNEDWTRWGPRRVTEVDFILVVVSKAWRDAWDGTGDPGRNLGATAEASALKSIEARDGRNALQERCRLIVLPESDDADVPTGLHGLQRYVLRGTSAADLEPLIRDLTDQPDVIMGPVGQVPVLPPSFGPPSDGSGTPIERVEDLRDRLAALPQDAPGDDPEQPWVRVRKDLEAELNESGASAEPAGNSADTESASNSALWVALPEPAPVRWRGGASVRTLTEGAVVVLHAVPVPGRRISRRLLDLATEALVDGLRSERLIDSTEGIDTATESDAVVIRRSPRPGRWDQVQPAEFSGGRVAGDGQLSIWFTLPKDTSGSVLDEGQTAQDIRRALALARAMLTVIGGIELVALGVELDDTVLLTDGALGDLGHRTSASMKGFASRETRVLAEEAVRSEHLGLRDIEIAEALARQIVAEWNR